jgi:hypothetical protein
MDIITFLAVYVKTLYEKTHLFVFLQVFVAMKYFVVLDTKKFNRYVEQQIRTSVSDSSVESVMQGAFYAGFLDEEHRNTDFVKFLIWLQLAAEKADRSGSVEDYEMFTFVSREIYRQLRVSLKPYMHLIREVRNRLEHIYGPQWYRLITYSVEEIMAIGVANPAVASKLAIAQSVERNKLLGKPVLLEKGKQYSETMSKIEDFVKSDFGIVKEDLKLKINCVPCASVHTANYARFLAKLSGDKDAIRVCTNSFCQLFEHEELLPA